MEHKSFPYWQLCSLENTCLHQGHHVPQDMFLGLQLDVYSCVGALAGKEGFTFAFRKRSTYRWHAFCLKTEQLSLKKLNNFSHNLCSYTFQYISSNAFLQRVISFYRSFLHMVWHTLGVFAIMNTLPSHINHKSVFVFFSFCTQHYNKNIWAL